MAYLLIQVSDLAYIERFERELNKRGNSLAEKFRSRFIAVLRNATNDSSVNEEIYDAITNMFDLDDDNRIFSIADLRK